MPTQNTHTQKHTWWPWVIGVVIVLALVGWYSLSQNDSLTPRAGEPTLTEVSFGYQPFGSNLPFFVAMEKGLFEKHGLKVEPVEILSANDAANAILQGRIVGDATIPLNVVLNIEEQSPGELKIFMVKASSAQGDWSDYLLVRADSPINELKDLEGKRIGGYPGSAQQALIPMILADTLQIGTFQTVELGPAVQLQALESGQVDALLTYDERAIMAIDSGIARSLVENPLGKYVVDPLYGFPYVLGTPFIKENPQAARAIRDAMYEAAEFIASNEREARDIMASWTGVSPEVAKKVRLWSQVPAEDINREALQKLADLFYEAGITQSKVVTDTLYLDLPPSAR